MTTDFLSKNGFITLTDDFVTELMDSENEEYEESDELYHYNFNGYLNNLKML